MLTIMFDPIYSPAQVKYEKYELGRIEPQLMFTRLIILCQSKHTRHSHCSGSTLVFCPLFKRHLKHHFSNELPKILQISKVGYVIGKVSP